MALPGTQMDAVSIARYTETADSDGLVTGTTATTWTGRGTWGSGSAGARQVAGESGETVTGFLILDNSVAVHIADRVTLRGRTYDVVGITDVRLHQRVALREVRT